MPKMGTGFTIKCMLEFVLQVINVLSGMILIRQRCCGSLDFMRRFKDDETNNISKTCQDWERGN